MSGLTTDQVVSAMDQLHGVSNATKLEFLRLLDHLDRTYGWREDGAASLENWVAYRYAMTWKAAHDHVDVMRALRDRPAIASAFATGLISWEVLVMLCTFVTPEEDEEWADRASRVSPREVRICARAARRRTREEAARLHDKRQLYAYWMVGGDVVRLEGFIPGAEGAMVLQTLDRIADQLGPKPDGTFDPREKRLADALIELVGTHIADDHDADRATLVVHVDARELNRINGAAHVENGPVIPSEVARRLSCDARIEVVAHDPSGKPLSIGRISRSVPPRIMRQLRARDVGCVVCGRAAGNHAHHVIPWAHGGQTDLDNLVLLCRRCHRLVHDGGCKLARDDLDEVKLVRRDGRPVSSRPTPLRPDLRARMVRPQLLPMRC